MNWLMKVYLSQARNGSDSMLFVVVVDECLRVRFVVLGKSRKMIPNLATSDVNPTLLELVAKAHSAFLQFR